ncbi:MAG TPA: penicillin-binding protein 2, partial [Aequorivita sp.]|nr:penicillin-binding protein 2 [Aequorivita sp.]
YDTLAKPLYDRVLMGEYPPGSPFKTLTALVGLHENAIDMDDVVGCTGGYHFGRRVLRCHHRGPVAMVSGIANSCNTYFCTVYKKIMDTYPTPQEGIDAWRRDLMSFGLGDFLGYDLPSGKRGNIPTSAYYNKIHDFPTHNWSSLATISN